MPELLYKVNPDRETPWNELPPLPIAVELYQSIALMESLGNAKAALARLHGRSSIIPNQGLLINTISLQEAKMSSEIENIFTTDDELYKAYSDSSQEQSGPAKEVLRYREALWSGHHYLKVKETIDLPYMLNVYREVTQAKDGIRPEFVPTVIKQGGSGPMAGRVIYTPPRGRGVLETKLGNLMAFLNDDQQFQIDPIIKMAVGHFQFEAIHPFRDGNGRTGRILNINYLTHKGLLDFPILFMSRYILDHKDEYYAGLSGVSQRGNWKEWLTFMFKALEQTSNITFSKINEIMAARDAILEFVKKQRPRFIRPEELIQSIFTQPFTKVKHLTDAGIYAENTARDYLNRLSALQVLEKKEIGGSHYYQNLELCRVLAD